jgi:hypothetical protein
MLGVIAAQIFHRSVALKNAVGARGLVFLALSAFFLSRSLVVGAFATTSACDRLTEQMPQC